MSQVVVHNCDGSTCLTSDDESTDDASLLEAGWLVVGSMGAEEDAEERVSHFCSYACLASWAQEMA